MVESEPDGGLCQGCGRPDEARYGKEGLRVIEDADRKREHELSDCLWLVLVHSDRYGIDLEKSFWLTMDELETRIDNHLDKGK